VRPTPVVIDPVRRLAEIEQEDILVALAANSDH